MTGVSRRTAVLAGAAVLVGAGGWRLWAAGHGPADSPQAVPAGGRATVVRADLAAREQIGGVLGYDGDWVIVHPGPAGILTAAPDPGAVVGRGQTLYEIDGRPVRLLIGRRPVWRDLTMDTSRGEDVRQLEQNLVALGHLHTRPDDRFTSATATAISRWQSALRVRQSGRLPMGSIVFAPEPLRIAAPAVPVGSRLGAGPALRASSNRQVITVALPTARRGNVSLGGPVLVTLPGGRRAPASITAIGRVATAPPATAGQATAPATIAVTATLTQPHAAGPLDQVPVQVAVTTDQHRAVLAVPVTALEAAPDGGYQITATGGPTDRTIAVRPGLFDELSGLVEVTGDGLAEGMTVVVPA